tara:strand:+ start:381 stop:923 length:543 start_codon:yes stop_codon:yes gene_type:complete
MVEDKNLIIDKRTFDISFYEMEIPFDNTSLIEVIKNTKMEQLQMLTTFEKDNQILQKEEMKDFKNHLFYFLDIFVKKALEKTKFNIINSWFQCYSKDSYHPLHIHGTDPNQWSLIYYIQVSENSSNTEIYGPGHPYIYFLKKIVKPKTNKLVIFPSCLPHEVLKNEDDKRIILSANLNID